MKTPRPHSFLRLALAAGFAFILGSARAADFTSTWNGGTANWTSTGNWSTPGAPGTFPNNGVSTYDAIQSAGTITLDQNITIQKFTFSGGTLTGTNNLTLNDNFTWTGGTMTGAGTTNILGGMTISGSGTKNFGAGRTLNIGDGVSAVTSTWSGGNIAISNNNTTFNNKANATFDVTSDNSLGGGFSTFNNAGTFTKSAGNGTTIIGGTNTWNFNNTGIVNVNSGTLKIDGGTSTGVFNVATGKTLDFAGSQTLTAASSVNGAGNLNFSASTSTISGTYALTGILSANGGTGDILVGAATAASINISSGAVNPNTGTLTTPTLTLSGGTLGGTGTVNVSGAVTWTGGTMTGTGTTNILGGMTISGSGTKNFGAGRTLNIGDGVSAVTSTWSGGNIAISNNKANATFDVTSDNSLGGGFSTFNNAGTFTKSAGNGTTIIGGTNTWNFNNTGIVNVNSGTLKIDGGTSTGVFNVATGKTLDFAGSQTLTAASSVNGAGNLNFSASTSTISGTYALTGILSANGGTGNILVGAATATAVNISSGAVNINTGTLTTPTLTLSGGTLGGTGTVNVTGTTTWTGGTMDSTGGGVTNLLGATTLSGGSDKSVANNRTVNNGDGTNAVTATWTGGNFMLHQNSVFNNKANATFEATSDGLINGFGTYTFNNAGTFTKSGGSGTTSIQGFAQTFSNTGTINVNSGSLSFGGTFSDFNQQSGTVTGVGTVNATHLQWSGGSFTGTGALNVSGGSNNITTSDAKGLDRTLNNTGTITYSSPVGSSIQFGVGTGTPGVINNSGTFDVTGNGNFQITNANAGHAINNSGTWNSTGSGNSTINTGIAFNNTGIVNVSSGRNFVVLGGGTHTGSFSVSSGSTLSLMGGQTNLNSGSSITGAGNVVLGGGPGVTVNAGSTYNTTGNTSLAGGNATFNTSATTGTFTGGTNQSQLTVSGATTKLKVNGTFTNNTEYTTLQGGAIIETTGFNLNGGELNGNGSINGPLTATGSGTIAPGASPGHLTVNGSTVLGGANTLAMQIGGLAAGIDYDLLTVNGILTLGGLLDVDFINGFENSVQYSDVFTIATATSPILGAFSNVASGSLLSTNFATQFRVYYGAGSPFGANNLVLSEAPEPSRAVLMLGGLLGVIMRRRRR